MESEWESRTAFFFLAGLLLDADGDGDAEALSLKDMLSATPALNALHLAIVRMGKSWQRQRLFHFPFAFAIAFCLRSALETT